VTLAWLLERFLFGLSADFSRNKRIQSPVAWNVCQKCNGFQNILYLLFGLLDLKAPIRE